MPLSDQPQRLEATNPRGSYIVQAPAGSGKTEMLSQRYLRLLATVSAPEQIVALTFTRKAASEMRERILAALEKSQNNPVAESAHQQQTLEWASLAMQQSNTHGWELLKHPGRLRIMTIDALCQSINRSIPLQEQAIPFAQVSENANLLFEGAARECVRYAISETAFQPYIICLLKHLDNNKSRVIRLLCQLLECRDQWLHLILEARQRSRSELEHALGTISEHEVARFKSLIPNEWQAPLLDMVRVIASLNTYKDYDLSILRDVQHFPELTAEQLVALSHILLNKQDKLRKKFDHWLGLKKEYLSPEKLAWIKSESTALMNALADIPKMELHCIRLRHLPSPHYSEKQWQILESLIALLPLLVSHLQLYFQEENLMDFAAISQQATKALGSEDDPTDLGLYFDNSIHHLLIDEFQDTSLGQMELIEKLVMGWSANEHRSLFLVGDPMQSIYRFRQAEVGLFLKAKREGVGAVKLQFLDLQSNFRSNANIVNWVNQHFHSVFPAQDDIEAGAVRYHRATAIHDARDRSYISAHCYENAQEEAKAIQALCEELLGTYPDQNIAILVRSRSHLQSIVSRFRAQGVAFQGVDIDLLAALPHIKDVWNLTQIFLHPANQLCWLSLLRSPFCGLPLSDILPIAMRTAKQPILSVMEDTASIQESISSEGYSRFLSFYNTMQRAFRHRHQSALVPQLSALLMDLGGSELYTQAQFADIEQFWQLLEHFEEQGMIYDLAQLRSRLEKLYSKQSQNARIQIMTIHKSKGLEFDTVILPNLGAKPNMADRPLMRWLHLPQDQGEALFLLAPLKAEQEKSSALYTFIQSLDAEKDAYETQRLLYVAATRAKQRLILCSQKEKGTRGSMQSLLSNIDFEPIAPHKEEATTQDIQQPTLFRKPLQEPQEPMTNAPFRRVIQHGRSYHPASLIGTLAHQLLQWASEHQAFQSEALPWAMINTQLRAEGIPNAEQDRIIKELNGLLHRTFSDPIAQWILSKHPLARNEHAFLEKTDQGVALKIPDRLFRDREGKTWVVDFKTGAMAKEAYEKHRQQVSHYAKILQHTYEGPIHCGIYYLSSNRWKQWVQTDK